MASVKLYRRIIPVNIFDIPGLETWLGDMAEKGYFCYDFGQVLGRFTKGAPKTVRYRLEPAEKDKDYPDVERRQLYMERGWRYVATVRKLYHIFIAENADMPELHTDPRIQSYTLDKLNRQMRAGVIAFTVISALMAAVVVRAAVRGTLVGDFILHARPFAAIILLLWLILAGQPIVYAVRIIRLRKRLRAGIPFEHHKSYRHRIGTATRITEVVIPCVVIAFYIATLAVEGDTGPSHFKPLSVLPADIPVLRLSDIVQDEDGDEAHDYGIGSFNGSTFWREYTILVPVQYTVSQSGALNGGTVAVSVTTHYYKPAFAFLTKPLFNELVNEFCRQNGMGNNDRVLDPGLLDGVVYAQNLDGQQLVAYKGNQILAVWYNGVGDLTEKLPLIARLLDESQPVP